MPNGTGGIASAGFGAGLFFFYLAGAMLHAYAVEDRVVPKEDEGEKGGLWRGDYAVVVRCDNSASIEKCVKEAAGSKKTHIKRDDDPSKSALRPDPAGETPWLTKDSKLLNPQ